MNPTRTLLRWRTAMTTVGGFVMGAVLLIVAPEGIGSAVGDEACPAP